jgi:outer membrane protein OmpA-like peptidoglycan-associated protein
VEGKNTIVPLDTFKTDQSGRYNFPLELNQQYKVLGNAPEYFANEVEVSTVGIEKDEELERNIDIELERIIIDLPIVLQNVYYDFDEYFIRQDAVIELNKLVKIMVQNANITIQLGSHTDSNGGDPYNMALSDNRAKACVRYLVESGIAPSRISWKGYGESMPLIYPEMTDQDEQANRRTEFRVLSIDYVPRMQ